MTRPQRQALDPDREIVDPHHHLWQRADIGNYLLADLHADCATGHHITETVFVECGASYSSGGPEHLRVVGETEFVAAIAEESEQADGPTIAGIVAHADLALDPDRLDEVLDAHEAAGGGRFRGIRDALASAPPEARDAMMIAGANPPDKGSNADFRRGVTRLGERDLTYDTWHYHLQNRDFLDLARAVPGTTMVLDHFGTPLGVGPFAGRHDEIFEQWADDITAIAGCDNVVAKLGGLAMPDNGFGWRADDPPSVEEFVAVQERWYHHTIEAFGPDRCMFESNFPVDKLSIDSCTMWNGLQTIASRYSDAEQDAMFSGTARRVYRI